MDAASCVEALKEALAKYGAPEICNTDQGSQFTSGNWIDVLTDAKIKVSMDGKGRWIDNRMVERLNRVIRKTTKTRDSVPTDDAATKLTYLAIRSFDQTGRTVREWIAARNQLVILYPERLNK